MRAEEFLQKIKAEFPEIQWTHYRFLTHGWDHDVMVLDDKFVFRAPKDVPKDLQSELYDETRLLDYLGKKVRIGIPEYIYISQDRSFAGYRLLTGSELTPARFRHFSLAEKEMFVVQMADFLTSFHQTPREEVQAFNIRNEDDRCNVRLARFAEEKIYPRLNDKEVQVINTFLDELQNVSKCDHTKVLTHSDLTWEHILWDKHRQRLNIIDFSDRAFGDPAWDFAGLWDYGPKLTERVFQLYQGPKDARLLYRSHLYYKRIALFVMQDALNGCPCTFEEGYEMFKKRFHTNPSLLTRSNQSLEVQYAT
jgi:aminoglycoside 2''-phosphotransferase